MGRLFWTFFFFSWIAQLTVVFGVGTVFWLEHQEDWERWTTVADSRPAALPPPPMSAGRPQPTPVSIGEPPPPPQEASPRPQGPDKRSFIPLLPVAIGLVVSLIIAALLAWYFSKPIRALRAAFDAAANGDLDVRASSAMGRRRDELADLGLHFDRMAGRLRDVMDGQRRLLHDVSHELRSPLARLQAAVDLLRQQPARLEDFLQRIERESMRMDRLVGELLTLSRLEVGVTPPMDEEIPVEELLDEIVRDARFEAEAKGRSVLLRMRSEATVRGDGVLLQRAIENVVRNAIRYTAPGCTVLLEAGLAPNARRVRLAVLDAGPGVQEGDLNAIFEPFFRSGEARDSNGYGLGLALARRVVEAHGGRIGARNRPEGGLCVEIDLPVL